MDWPHRGSCLCGSVRYAAGEFAPKMAHCHCSMCRKFHGAAFATFGSTRAFRWLSGEAQLASFTAANGTVRQFCQQCGSSLTFQSPATPAGVVEIALGTLDTPLAQRPDAHIWVGSGADWYSPTAELPCHHAGRSSELVCP
ncbi:GFA family protein [Chitinibacter tainanensis]|uniref:GFA family protein n=1 Tax=Chitinibacter tainanensis TaxID=230667 RepID=UPI000423ED8A|nr:GFA family protein [Chitinibacter tainanensis]